MSPSVEHAIAPLTEVTNRTGRDGRSYEIAATGTVAAPAAVVFAFLADLENHWAIADRFVEVETLEGPAGARVGGVVAIHGPLGVRRRAETRVLAVLGPHWMIGTAAIGGRTRARVRWSLDDRGATTRVELAASVEAAGTMDRLLLASGGRQWLRRRFAGALVRLATHFEATSPARRSDDQGRPKPRRASDE